MKHKGKMFTTMNSLMNVLEETAFFSYIYLFVGGGGRRMPAPQCVCRGQRTISEVSSTFTGPWGLDSGHQAVGQVPFTC